MASKPKYLLAAEAAGKEWVVAPPEKDYPIPEIGYRLMQRIKGRWVTIQIGHPRVLGLIETNQQHGLVPTLKPLINVARALEK